MENNRITIENAYLCTMKRFETEEEALKHSVTYAAQRYEEAMENLIRCLLDPFYKMYRFWLRKVS
jgi:hypothetical protein